MESQAIKRGQLKTDFPEIKSGYTVRVYQKVKEGDKERLQPFEGMVIAVKHGKGINATFTVRKISDGIGVERIFPLHSPTIEKIEVLKEARVRRAKLYYMRKRFGKAARLKQKIEVLSSASSAETSEPEVIAETEPATKETAEESKKNE